ncbi:MAG: pyruvate kinase [Hydrogenophilus sp.]|nr:pyruvate kinase [Hydrogenophilus sp.]
MRHTKIVATLGPASDAPTLIERLIHAGVNLFRLNFSHGTSDDHRRRARNVRQAAAQLCRPVGLLGDLQGPKIRIGRFAAGSVDLKPGQTFSLDADLTPGDQTRVGLDYPDLIADVDPGDTLLLDDGKIRLTVIEKTSRSLTTQVLIGGKLTDHKGINKLGGGLSAPALTEKDRNDIQLAAEIGVDYLAVSFVKHAEEMVEARHLLRAAGSAARLIAKIERVEAVQNLDEILYASDGVMVARGDLAVEVGDAAVPALQKRIIRRARELNRLTITATQMMESMIGSPIPTRAEVSDVANAVLDGTDAVMLSAETAAGNYPLEAVEAMARVCEKADASLLPTLDHDLLGRRFDRVDEAIAVSAVWSGWHLGVKAIVALTQSGATALWMSRITSNIPIYALTPDPHTFGHLTLFRQVTPAAFEACEHCDPKNLMNRITNLLLSHGWVSPGDKIAVTFGEPMGQPGGSNTLKIITVP